MAGSKAIRRLLRGEHCGAKTSTGVCLGTPMAPGQRCRRCVGHPDLKEFAVGLPRPAGLPSFEPGKRAGTMATALWQLAGGVMEPEGRRLLLELSQIRPDMSDQILIMQTMLLALIAQHGKGEISQEVYQKGMLDLSEQIRKLFESQAKVRLADAELAKHNPNHFGEDALDPEKLNE